MQTKTNIVAAALLAFTHWLQLSAAENSALKAEQDRNANRTLSIGYVIYEGFTILDVFGPLEFIAGLSWPLKINFTMIAKTPGIIHTRPPFHHDGTGGIMDMSHMIDAQVVATHSFTTAPPLDVLIVPGGIGEVALLENKDRAIEDFIVSRFDSTEYILSVCTGASFLARAGVLDGRRATANKAVWKTATAWGKNVSWVPSARWVEDGKVWTSSGVSAGMDMMVAFLRRVYGDERVNNVVNGAEYIPQVDPSWDPFSVIHKVPGANMSMPLEQKVSPLQVQP